MTFKQRCLGTYRKILGIHCGVVVFAGFMCYTFFMENFSYILPGSPYKEEDVARMNALTLAYIGDAVYALSARKYIVMHSGAKVGALHTRVNKMVNAKMQAEMYYVLEPMLTEKERMVLHHGRNAKALHKAKNFSATDYKKATAVEALLGYIYVSGQTERLEQLLEKILEETCRRLV